MIMMRIVRNWWHANIKGEGHSHCIKPMSGRSLMYQAYVWKVTMYQAYVLKITMYQAYEQKVIMYQAYV